MTRWALRMAVGISAAACTEVRWDELSFPCASDEECASGYRCEPAEDDKAWTGDRWGVCHKRPEGPPPGGESDVPPPYREDDGGEPPALPVPLPAPQICGRGGYPCDLGHGICEGSSCQGVNELLAAGGWHTLWGKPPAVAGWGRNAYGQLGDGSQALRLVATPVLLPEASGLGSLDATFEHSCATLGGYAYCWGRNQWGQGGKGYASDTPEPFPTAVPLGQPIAQVATGYGFTCARASGGAVWCWGRDGLGETGRGTVPGVNQAHPDPQPVIGIEGASWLSAGDYSACAVVPGGQVACWGYGEDGRLGQGAWQSSGTPVMVSGLSQAVMVEVGGWQACALLSSGEVRCWGDDQNGGLGDGGTTNQAAPVGVTGGHFAVQIALGNDHGCLLDGDGDVWCWGANEYGQIHADRLDRPNPIQVDSPCPARQLALGAWHTCWLCESGPVCRGRNSHGQLGHGEKVAQLSPVPMAPAPTVAQVGTGYAHTCVRDGGIVACAGDNSSFQLGRQGPMAHPGEVVVVLDEEVGLEALEVGLFFTCVLRQGDVLCFGDGADGQLGCTNPSGGRCPDERVPGISQAKLVSAGGAHACAIAMVGVEDPAWAVRCWGDNTFGQLGTGDTEDRSTATLPLGLELMKGNMGHVSAGTYHTCAVVLGKVLCWGAGGSGRLGDGGTQDRHQPVAVAWPVDDPRISVVSVSAGTEHTCAVDSNAQAYCWGSNNAGKLGSPGGDALTPRAVAGIGGGVKEVHAGALNTTCALLFDGRIFCWGQNTYGQMGDGTDQDSAAPKEVAWPSGGAQALSVGAWSVCALGLDGRPLCWGDNAFGQLGTGEIESPGPYRVGQPLPEDDQG